MPAAVHYAGGAAAGPAEDTHAVPAKNRWSRVALTFRDVPAEAWCSFVCRLAWEPDEPAEAAADFVLAGFDFLAPDGSSLDFDHVPGLTRTLLDPHSAWIPGPAYQPAGAEAAGAALVRIAFLVPAPARQVAVSLRSWRNALPFEVARPRLHPHDPAQERMPPRRRRPLAVEPDWLDHALVPGERLIVRGQLFAEETGDNAALVRVAYHDGDGAEIAPPYPEIVSTPAFGALVDLPAHRQARRFTLELAPPPGAARVRLGFAAWDSDNPVELLAPPEVSLADRLRLESLSGDDLLDAPTLAARLADRLGRPGESWGPAGPDDAPAVLDRASAVQRGPASPLGPWQPLRLAGQPEWRLPERPDWSEDPFRSPAWRLDYQSLSWLAAMAAGPDGLKRALDLALSWSRHNPWGRPSDGLSLHPAALSARAEVLIGLLARAEPEGEAARLLAAEVVRHGLALSEIVGQNTFARSLHQIHAAVALLAVGRGLPACPLAGFWSSLARLALREGFDALLGPDGAFTEPSLHARLELLTLGRVLIPALAGDDLATFLAERTGPAVPALAGLLDPGGRLPPFGDGPHGVDHAGWIGRLLALDGRAMVAERAASRAPAPGAAGVIAARYDAPGRGWGHFACGFAGQGAQDHRDCSSFVFATGGARWIVEAAGSGQFETGALRQYLLSSRGHNVAHPDGREQGSGNGWLVGSTRLDGAVLHEIATSVHGPEYRHRRIFVVLDDLGGLAVFDRFETRDRPVGFEGLLHLAPDAMVALANPRLALAGREQRRLRLVPRAILGQPGGLEVVNGRNDRPGSVQGFVSRRPGALRPASLLRYTVSGRGRVCGGVLVAIDEAREQRLAALVAGEAVARRLAGE
ncbi:heparinase II/III domain-containing protein [Methylobacterium oryzihabitans]|uniref:heparinase II/III domain-containing protein n=1 Tax=Methylobacterium oryzihabitans TaxID=2499852 RepID=UPI001FEC0750|nr:heparinase II/III family protein [Methylobacterium oryzihabitans]